MITVRDARISQSPKGYEKGSIALRPKTTSRGIRAKGKYLPKYLTRSGRLLFVKKRKGTDLIRNVVRADAAKIMIILFIIIFHLSTKSYKTCHYQDKGRNHKFFSTKEEKRYD